MGKSYRRPKGKKPREGDRVRFVTWIDDKKPIEGTVTVLLNTQFVILSDEGDTYYQFYSDHGQTWKVI